MQASQASHHLSPHPYPHPLWVASLGEGKKQPTGDGERSGEHRREGKNRAAKKGFLIRFKDNLFITFVLLFMKINNRNTNEN